ncbi:MAG: 1,4-dihydroxy-2-naphthoate octaprenyltransferase [Bacillota bacterium]
MAQSEAVRPGAVAVWIREMRVPFFTGSAVPVALGAAVAWYETGIFSPALFALTLLGAFLAHAGANMTNDYYDWRSGNDDVNRFRSMFNGGAGLIQERKLTPNQVHLAALAALGSAAVIGLYLASVAGPGVVVLMLAGGFMAYFYTGEPLRLAYYGVGELMVGLSFGPLLVAGAYLVQTGTVSPAVVAASVPVGLLITAVLYINQFPDYEADRAVGKAHWVVRLGSARAVAGLGVLLLATHLWVAGSVAVGLAPWPVLAALATAPLSLKAYRLTQVFHDAPVELRPANAMVIGNHLLTGLLVTAGFVAARLLGV